MARVNAAWLAALPGWRVRAPGRGRNRAAMPRGFTVWCVLPCLRATPVRTKIPRLGRGNPTTHNWIYWERCATRPGIPSRRADSAFGACYASVASPAWSPAVVEVPEPGGGESTSRRWHCLGAPGGSGTLPS